MKLRLLLQKMLFVLAFIPLVGFSQDGCTDPTACNYDATATVDDGSCLYGASGCTDDAAFNYMNWAICDDGSCQYLGCTDSTAWNYDSTANTDDGSCIPFMYGCMDSTMFNYDSTANTDDGSCIPFINGCTDATACSYDAAANTDDGSCLYPTLYYNCAGDCLNDSDLDGVCDELEVPGCTDTSAINYDPTADTDDGSCDYLGCTDLTACNYDATATVDDSSCDLPNGCGDPLYQEYNVNVTCSDTSACINLIVVGCTDVLACNYNSNANTYDGSCIYATGCETCSGETDGTGTIVDNDADDDGVCDADEIPGCTDVTACNYDATATDDNGSCVLPDGCTDSTAFNYDPNATCDDGSCIAVILGCTDTLALNYDANANANTDDGSCIGIGSTYEGGIIFYLDGNGGGWVVAPIDQSDTIGASWGALGTDLFGANSQGLGMQNTLDILAQSDEPGIAADLCASYNGGGYSDWYLPSQAELNEMWNSVGPGSLNNVAGLTSDYYYSSTEINTHHVWLLQTNNGAWITNSWKSHKRGVRAVRAFGGIDIQGCIDQTACNYNPYANVQFPNTCMMPDGCTDPTMFNYNSSAICDDGSCVPVVLGCTNPSACNYDASANTEDLSCVFPDGICETCSGETDGTGTIVDNDADDDGVCDADEIPGCTDATACNYDSTATDDDNSCLTDYGCMDPAADNYDANATCDDGLCIYLGCTDPTALNYDPNANSDDGSCVPVILGCMDTLACNYDASANIDDGSCELPDGCMDPSALNYDPTAICDDGSCVAVVLGCMDPSACNYDATANVNDGSCSGYYGCTDPLAFNYDANAGCDDGSCIAVVLGCTDVTACNYDASANTDDGSCLTDYGCTDPLALNYDSTATCDDGSCIAVALGCTDATACNYDASANTDDSSCKYNTEGASATEVCGMYMWEGQLVITSGVFTHVYEGGAANGCDSTHTLTVTMIGPNNVTATIDQQGGNLIAVTTPSYIDGNTNWYNIQTDESGNSRIWLMEENAATYSPTFDCSYFIVATDEYGCSDTSVTYLYAEQAARIGELTTYPNPATNKVSVTFDNDNNQVVHLDLMDNNGVKINEYITINNYLDIDLSKYPSGVYYLSFDSKYSAAGCLKNEKERSLTKIILNK